MTTGKTATSEPTRNSTVLVAGAGSSLAQAVCRVLAARGYTLTLAGRDLTELELLAADLSVRSKTICHVLALDISPGFDASYFLAHAGDFSHVLIATGVLCEGDELSSLDYITHVNYTAPAQLAALAAQKLETAGGGAVTIISSVAGDRGRSKRYAYAAAKSALSTFASGLRSTYCRRGVHVLTIKPGFIDTPMTWGMKSPLIASREYCAKRIVDAMEQQKDVAYVPFFWWWIMAVLCAIPERIFKKLRI